MLIFELVSDFYRSLLIHFFILFGLKRKKHVVLAFFISFLCQGFSLSFCTLCRGSINTLWTFLIPIIYSIVFFDDHPLSILVWDAIMISVFFGLSSIITLNFAFVFHVPRYALISNELSHLMPNTIINILIAPVFYYLIKLKLPEIQDSLFLFLILVVLSITIGLSVVCLLCFTRNSIKIHMAIGLDSMSFIISLISIMMIIIMKRHERNELVLRRKELRNTIEEKRINELNSIYLSIQKIRHDVKEHINIVHQLYNSGMEEEGYRSLHQLEESLPIVYHTGIPTVDAELACKKTQIEALGIRCQITVSPLMDISISDIDLCSVIHNILENAIEELQNVSESSSFIHFEIITERDMIKIQCLNSLNLKSPSKRHFDDSFIHGLGTQIIDDFVKKYHGFYKKEKQGAVYNALVIVEKNPSR